MAASKRDHVAAVQEHADYEDTAVDADFEAVDAFATSDDDHGRDSDSRA